MPSYRNPSPPLSSFNKPTSPHSSQPSPSVFSTTSIPSQYSENMIPPQHATNLHPSPQFSNISTTFQPQFPTPPSAAEQNSILSQTWLWLPQYKCSLLNDPNPHAVYLITLATWDGYQKRFDLQLLPPSSIPNRSSRPEILHNILEHELLAPREAIFHNTTSLPLRPRVPVRRISTGLSVGMHGQAIGIPVSNAQAPFQHHGYGSSVSGASEFMYSPYNDGVNSPPQQYFGNDQRMRYPSGNDSDGRAGSFSSSTASSSDREGRRDRGSGSGFARSGRDVRQKERRRSGSRDNSISRERGRDSSDRSDSDRDEKRRSSGRKGSGSERKRDSHKESSKSGKRESSKEKEKGGSKGKKSFSRSSSLSSTRSFVSLKKK